jgi:hypothetical protein
MSVLIADQPDEDPDFGYRTSVPNIHLVASRPASRDDYCVDFLIPAERIRDELNLLKKVCADR